MDISSIAAWVVRFEAEAIDDTQLREDRLNERLAFAMDHGADLTTNQVDQVSGRRTWADRVT